MTCDKNLNLNMNINVNSNETKLCGDNKKKKIISLEEIKKQNFFSALHLDIHDQQKKVYLRHNFIFPLVEKKEEKKDRILSFQSNPTTENLSPINLVDLLLGNKIEEAKENVEAEAEEEEDELEEEKEGEIGGREKEEEDPEDEDIYAEDVKYDLAFGEESDSDNVEEQQGVEEEDDEDDEEEEEEEEDIVDESKISLSKPSILLSKSKSSVISSGKNGFMNEELDILMDVEEEEEEEDSKDTT